MNVVPKNAAVAVDTWKMPIFERLLNEYGYAWEKVVAVGDMTMLKVKTTNMAALAEVIEKAQAEAARSKPHGK